MALELQGTVRTGTPWYGLGNAKGAPEGAPLTKVFVSRLRSLLL